jgi:hypothetical protein
MRRLSKLFTSTYDNFIQTAGIRDGASHCAKILSVFYDSLNTWDPNDPEVIIKIDMSNAFNTTCRALTLDVLSGRASRDYACGLKRGDAIPTCENLSASSWSSPPLVLLRDIHNGLIANCDCKDTATPESQPGARVRVGLSSQDGVSQQQEAAPPGSSFRSSTASMRHPLCGERTLPTLLLLSSRHRIGSPFRSSTCVFPLKFSNRPLWSHVVLNNFADV